MTTDPEVARPGAPFQGVPHPADHKPVSPVAARVGPPLAIVSLAVTAALLLWIAFSPTAIGGPLSAAPFEVPATLVTNPGADGCANLAQGDGTTREVCLQDASHGEAYFAEDGTLIIGQWQDYRIADPATGDVLGPYEQPVDPPVDGSPPSEVPGGDGEVWTQGDTVVRGGMDGESEPLVLLDVKGPPGYQLGSAVLSPDGDWIIATTPDETVIVAPADGSAPPYVWVDLPQDGWIDLWRGIRWD